MKEAMFWLAKNYWVGIGIATGVIVIVYVLISLAIFFKSRKKGVEVAVGAMIPIWHLKYPVQGILINRIPKPRKEKKVKKTK